MFQRRNKYGAKRINTHGGKSFASKLEASLYDHLALLQVAGEISDLKCQPNVLLTSAKIRMIPDYSFQENGSLIYAEAKGFETDVWRIKRRLWKVYGPAPLRVYKKIGRGLELVEVLIPKGE